LSILAEKKKISGEDKSAIWNRIYFTTTIQDCTADIFIEAIIEKIEAKHTLFKQLEKMNSVETIFATNTSSLSVSVIAENLQHASRVIGMHFFNPAPLMKLVEVVKGKQTADDVAEIIMRLSRQLGKIPVLCKDAPGFIVNRVARHYYLEALKIAEEGFADFETIDSIMEATGFKMGPFKLMDLIGNDINLAVTKSIYEACGRPVRFKPSPLQELKVKSGALGRKSGKGYYDYN
jgi:3-hydroxybutyryl-CoA dehydrogenase